MIPKDILVEKIDVGSKEPLYFTGPSLQDGKTAAVIYFSIGGKDSLSLDPFNQLVQFLPKSIRVFSWDLPFHTPPLKPEKAIEAWAQQIQKGNDPFLPFWEESMYKISYILENLSSIESLAIAGLSRGAFFALQLAARKNFPFVLGLAPLLDLGYPKELHPYKGSPILASYALDKQISSLYQTQIRLFLGNHDTRVGSAKGFAFLQKLVDEALVRKLRQFPFELEYYPSVGHLGHGTPPSIFKKGACWIEQCLKCL